MWVGGWVDGIIVMSIIISTASHETPTKIITSVQPSSQARIQCSVCVTSSSAVARATCMQNGFELLETSKARLFGSR